MEVVASVFTYSTTCISIQDKTQVGEARRKVSEIVRNLQFDESAAGRASIVVTELGNNIVNHGGGGQLLLNPVWRQEGSWLDIIALDRGQGMAEVSRCMEDGYSTIGTAGNGLGAVKRLSALFEIVSLPGSGTAALSRLACKEKMAPWAHMEIAAVNLPKTGEDISGDAWAARHIEDKTLLMVADGLGHGVSAAEAANKSIQSFSLQRDLEIRRILEDAHFALRATRGAAVAVTELNHKEQLIQYCGIGNIAGTVLDPTHTSKTMISQNGIIGHDSRRVRAFEYAWKQDNLIIMHSDGLQSQWSLQKYPGIFRRSAALIAGILYRDYSRGTDDLTVVVAKP